MSTPAPVEANESLSPPARSIDRARIEALASNYRLSMPERQRSTQVGELAGRKAGSSIEFQDRKDYTPGDDLRSVDWRAYARTDRLSVKLYREEICPTVEILVDRSLSMATTPEKRQRNIELVYLFWLLAQKHHALVRLKDLCQKLAPIRHPLDLVEAQELAQEDPMPLLRRHQMASRGGIVIVISDLLFRFDPVELVNCLSRADRVLVIQLLSSFEDAPQEGTSLRLQDAETLEFLDVKLDHATVEGYRKRLETLSTQVIQRLRLYGGAFTRIVESDNLDVVMKKLLTSATIEV